MLANMKQRSATIFDPDVMAEFCGKSNLNIIAKNKESLFHSEQDRRKYDYEKQMREADFIQIDHAKKENAIFHIFSALKSIFIASEEPIQQLNLKSNIDKYRKKSLKYAKK